MQICMHELIVLGLSTDHLLTARELGPYALLCIDCALTAQLCY